MEQSKFYQIKNVTEHEYTLVSCDGSVITRPIQDVDKSASAFTIQDVKDGDFLVCGKDKLPFIFKGFLDRFHPDCPVAYCGICKDGIFSVSSGDGWWTDEEVFPANKKQREQLEKAITDAGFMWDAKQKKLKKIDEEVNGEDYGIDSLWHAQNILEKTFGSVDGYQSDDGILEHKCAISVVKKLYKQKPTDEEMKELLQTEYEKGKADAVAEMQKSWSEKDEKQLNDIMWIIEAYRKNGFNETHIQIADNSENWLKSLKDRVQPKKEWSEEDEKKFSDILAILRGGENCYYNSPTLIDWLKSLKDRYTWKPSEEMLEALYKAIPENVMAMSEDEMLLDKLYQGLKYGRVLSKN